MHALDSLPLPSNALGVCVCMSLQVYEMLVTEHSIDSSLRTYCPYKDCSCLLERPDDIDEAAAAGQDHPFECPACHRHFCLCCGIAGWHTVSPCRLLSSA
eukprot:GHRQ01033698.1.p1 GENE.GHRQ01033698.1~~GHRQ01033698.1.p1  ORF type:complete len:100 (-),score=12.14 GHRQ01033698.1:5-304(-)